jgi:hypothetical protein
MSRRATILGLCLTVSLAARAQTHKVDAPQKVTRALAVYEWTGELDKPAASRLIPISIFINGHFEDAGVYLAQPTPMALDAGDVYSIERAGESLGTFDVDYASNIATPHSVADDNPTGVWYGFGRFLSVADAAKLVKPKPAAKLPVVASTDAGDTDDKPHFVRRDSSSTATTTSPAKPGASKDSSASTAPNTPDDDPDRPTLRHRDPDEDAKKKKNNKPTGYVSGPNSSLNDDPDRPTLRRGVPTGFITPPQLAGLPPNLHQAVAISDAAYHDPHVFNREWDSSTDRAQTLAGLEALATPRLANYIAVNKLIPVAAAKPATSSSGPSFASAPAATRTPAASTSAHARARKAAAAPAPPSLADEHLSGYTLSYGGLPTFIYTVESPVADGGPVYLTLVAQRLPTGELQVALSSITDATHLNRTPWMRPIDVVDPDWSHRASLLFELRGQSSRQFALYRLVSPQAEQTFVTGVIE